MKDMVVFLYSPNSKVTQQMFDCYYLPNQGLEKQNQGRLEFMIATPRKGKTRLGYFEWRPLTSLHSMQIRSPAKVMFLYEWISGLRKILVTQ